MITRRKFNPLLAFLLLLAAFAVACDNSDGDSEDVTNTSDNVMYSTPDAEDANYDNEVTVDQATAFSEETAVASEDYSQSRDFGTQPRGPKPEKELEYFNNAYQKAYSTSTTHQRAVVPGYQKKKPSDDYDDNTPVGYPNTPSPDSTKKGLFDGQQPTQPSGGSSATSSIKSQELSRADNPTDYVKPDSTRQQ